jgi:hypothetical protein
MTWTGPLRREKLLSSIRQPAMRHECGVFVWWWPIALMAGGRPPIPHAQRYAGRTVDAFRSRKDRHHAVAGVPVARPV